MKNLFYLLEQLFYKKNFFNYFALGFFKGLRDLKDVLVALAQVLLLQLLHQHVVAAWDKILS